MVECGESSDRFVGPTSPWESLNDKTVGHVGHGDLKVWVWGLNKPVATQPPNLVLWPNICPSTNFRAPLDHCGKDLAKIGGSQSLNLNGGMHASSMRLRGSGLGSKVEDCQIPFHGHKNGRCYHNVQWSSVQGLMGLDTQGLVFMSQELRGFRG